MADLEERTATSIAHGKRKVVQNGTFGNKWLAGKIEHVRANDYYVVNNGITPRHAFDGIHEIPYTSLPEERYLWQRFLKRGPLVMLNSSKSTLEEMVKRGKTPMETLSGKAGRINHYEVSGYGFWNPGNNTATIIHLVDCLKGAAFFIKTNEKKKQEDRIRVGSKGKDIASVYLPSQGNERKPYEIGLNHVALSASDGNLGDTYRFGFQHGCKFSTNLMTNRFSNPPNFPDFHVVAAYLQLAYDEKKLGSTKLLEMSPFLIPTKKFLKFYDRLQNNVVVQYRDGDYKMRRRPLRMDEQEILLWRFIERNGFYNAARDYRKAA
jgi:hypothetical protein